MRRILIVDDDEDIRKIAALSLSRIGKWQVLTASSGQEGLAMAERHAPSAILLDVMMPGMDGPATLEQLRGRPATSNIPVVFLTARGRQHDIDEYRNSGAVGVLLKPFDPLALAADVEKLLGLE